ncbi:GNAT family N-acetyltransferase [Mucilaginibacter sp.]|uniref:GNAT family N-acetyltransferase n=1 Tax=Mucilaginibacter sp. TaxID=1882438 RepID=UPI00261DD020|nr:GNAT family N-acetyltransferase [Mucilaginibacter sp.]MDB4927463.1 family N-acetyltransferase [Mucilaginibacter sp.]
MITIEQIRPELTWRLRRRVMYPNKKLYEMEMEEDNLGYHFGAFKGDSLVGVVSLFQQGTDFQFRKFAVDIDMQNMGIGKTLLNYIEDFAIAEGAKRIWCNSRVTAMGFYSRYGFAGTGTRYTQNGIDYEVMEKTI